MQRGRENHQFSITNYPKNNDAKAENRNVFSIGIIYRKTVRKFGKTREKWEKKREKEEEDR